MTHPLRVKNTHGEDRFLTVNEKPVVVLPPGRSAVVQVEEKDVVLLEPVTEAEDPTPRVNRRRPRA